jgi:methionine-rich copper-binding protein CopC
MSLITKITIILIALISFHSVVLAHSKVTTTQPTNDAVLQKAPTTIGLDFDKKIRLTKVTLQRVEQDAVDLDLSQFKDFRNSFSLSNTLQGKGVYTINWRGLSIDGHVMQGEFSFTVE